MVLQVHNLQKKYKSGFQLGPVDLELSEGETVGLIGRNGAGKTTLLRLLLGALRPDRGGITFFNDPSLSSTEIKARIGYVDEESVLYSWMTTKSVEWFFRRFYANWDSKRFHRYIQELSIPEGRPFKQLSRGNKVKLWIVTALSVRPDLLILDEPTSGLDPVTRRDILEILRSYRAAHPDTVLLFSSHIIADLELISDRVVMIEEGQILADLAIAELDGMTAEQSSPISNVESAYFNLIAAKEKRC